MPQKTTTRSDKSTNVRSRLAVARGTLQALGAVSPPLAGRLAYRLFTTTQRRDPREGERDVLSSARRFVVPFEQERMVAWSWGRGPTALLAHGWNGRATQLAGFVEPLRAAGFRVVAFDSVGHGSSTGSRANIVDFAKTIAAVADAAGGAHSVIAHSMGGAATTIALADGLELERAVFIAAPIDPGRWVAQFTKMLALDDVVEGRFRAELARRAGRPPSELHGELLAPHLRVPLLAIHDVDDREVPASSSVALTRAWPGAQLHETQGLGHQRILTDPDVIARSVRFVAESLPKGVAA